MAETMMIPASFGEVLDKITILEIKSERMHDPAKLANVRLELDELNGIWARTLEHPASVNQERQELKAVNEKLWDIEDAIREQESAGDFGERFVELARQVYFTNDERAAIKKKVNLALGSRFVEEKSYRNYCRSG
ncbi:hypothetical protein DES49_0437 [Halospina denitrificans]|uniref:Uncharacterized protein n=1 Tax=Halospina denitrificans TaxID=332522 RepID=A0A4R7K176_9GAMM|nr:DUF6165 family protein [Halospina denitrificans]TDT44335.1 hypothetical protein DES49_0437 [Halospina denitrificans]